MSTELENQTGVVELDVCRVCNKPLPKISMSKVDDTICARCASKLISRAQLDDGSWLEDGLSIGVQYWEQFPTEPRSAFLAFRHYIDAYPKELSIKEICSSLGYGEATIRHWMKRWKWKERFFEWSRKCDKEAMVQQREIRKDMNDRQIKLSNKLHQMAMARIERIDMDELSPKEVLAWAELAAKLERTAVTDNREVMEAEIESRSYVSAVEKKATAGTDDSGMQEILDILASSGAIQIETSTKITTPKTVDAESEVIDEDNVVDTNYEESDDDAE